ncbi:MAG: acetyl-CoA hydrolase/transferase C-terminal domain-containing protein [Syntrophomonadaceae bacterium]|nr:acetyl-CoA hydrolase/transferase C-terminal domain-containing protein [Syntrophomonadaceae bacterium]
MNSSTGTWQEQYRRKLFSAEEVAAHVRDGDRICLGGGDTIPRAFVHEMLMRAENLNMRRLYLMVGFTQGKEEFMEEKYDDMLRMESIFIGSPPEREAARRGSTSYVPTNLGNIREWLDTHNPRIVAIGVSPPNEDGYMSRSTFGGLCHRSIIENAEIVIAEVNNVLPNLGGPDLKLHVSEVDYILEDNHPLGWITDIPTTEKEQQIGAYIADFVPNGATIQLGFGGLSTAVGFFLKDKKDLGVHSEVIGTSIVDLMKCGAINNSKKTYMPGKSVGCFSPGNASVIEYLHNNEDFFFTEIGNINDPNIIARNNAMISINNTLMIDLTGQANSEALGKVQYSGSGGQLQFVIGSQMSPGGVSILALNSTYIDKQGRLQSKIVPEMPAGSVITTPRTFVDVVVTEYGAVKLKYISADQRMKALISIAHPDFRDELRFYVRQWGRR